jgi:hypothetical protein
MDENMKRCLLNLILIAVTVIMGAEMVKSLNRFGLIETYFQEIADNSVPTTGEKVGKDTLGSKDPQVMFGTPTGLVPGKSSSMSNSDEDAPSDGMGNKTKVLFKHNKCAPEYCEMGNNGTNYSCDKGCVKMEKSQNELVASRGDGVYPNAPDTGLKYRNKCLIDDKWCTRQ